MAAEAWVREAFDEGWPAREFELHFQPVVWLESGAVHGAESFLRWRHPDRGVVAAMDWLPYAIERGVLADCARAILPAWVRSSGRAEGPIISFNLSGQQLLDRAFMAALLDTPPDLAEGLALEVHHLQFFVDRARTVAPEWSWVPTPDLVDQLAALRARGFSVWLDDFGDGTVDETPLDQAEIDVVKLDRSLLGFSPDRLADVVGRIEARGGVVMIEGVENDDHSRLALDAGIDLAQGFLFGWSMTEGEFAEHLTTVEVRRR